MAHHPFIKKEVNELLAKGAIEPSTGSAGINSNVCGSQVYSFFMSKTQS